MRLPRAVILHLMMQEHNDPDEIFPDHVAQTLFEINQGLQQQKAVQ